MKPPPTLPISPAETLIRQRLRAAPEQRLPFYEVMRLALYEPRHGYYSTVRPIGRGGDFYTAVSVGPVYGLLLAQTIEEAWRTAGEPSEYHIIEQGAHDGQLAADIWAAVQKGPLAAAAHYTIIELRENYRVAQRTKLGSLIGERLHFARVFSAEEAPVQHGFFLANELLDAFPCSRVRWTGSAWEELYVREPGPRAPLQWVAGPVTEGLVQAEVAHLPTDLPAGYTTEVHAMGLAFAKMLLSHPFKGAALFADYGYEAAEYYIPERADGTLRRYIDHRVDGEVLSRLGRCDLTAHVNFTRLIDIAQAAGFSVKRFLEQGRFLTLAATPWLKSMEGQAPSSEAAAQLRQFISLTHPGHMGAAFRLLLLERP